MPTYLYRCPAKHLTEEFRFVEQRDAPAICDRCGDTALRAHDAELSLSAPQVIPDIPEHYNPTTGGVVKSRRHLADLQKRNGWQDYEPLKSKDEGIHSAYQVQWERQKAGLA